MTLADQTHLRLVGEYAEGSEPLPAASVSLPADDPRWVLAAHVQHQLQGAMLTPDRRSRVLRLARQLGLRPFEANLIIAVVQDHARCGRSLSEAQPLLSMMNKPRPHASIMRWQRMIAAFICAVVATSFMIWWMTG